MREESSIRRENPARRRNRGREGEAAAPKKTVAASLLLLQLLAFGTALSALPRAQDGSASDEIDSESSGYFSAAQAERGADRYRALCTECHTTSQFKGPEFEWRWRRQTAWDLYRELSTTMPETDPGSLDPETYAAIVAYLLSLNQYQQGGEDLPPTQEALSSIALGAGAAKSPSPP